MQSNNNSLLVIDNLPSYSCRYIPFCDNWCLVAIKICDMLVYCDKINVLFWYVYILADIGKVVLQMKSKYILGHFKEVQTKTALGEMWRALDIVWQATFSSFELIMLAFCCKE